MPQADRALAARVIAGATGARLHERDAWRGAGEAGRPAADTPGPSWSARQGTLHAEVPGALNYRRSDKLGRYDRHTLA